MTFHSKVYLQTWQPLFKWAANFTGCNCCFSGISWAHLLLTIGACGLKQSKHTLHQNKWYPQTQVHTNTYSYHSSKCTNPNAHACQRNNVSTNTPDNSLHLISIRIICYQTAFHSVENIWVFVNILVQITYTQIVKSLVLDIVYSTKEHKQKWEDYEHMKMYNYIMNTNAFNQTLVCSTLL